MALYSFNCTSCNKEFEEIVKVGTEIVACPSCNEWAERNHTPDLPNFQLIGQSWARDNYTTAAQKQAMAKNGTLNKSLGLMPKEMNGISDAMREPK